MNSDFHYYATYCASLLAGYSNKDALRIAYSASFVDCCTSTLLKKCGLPISATTTQSQFEMIDFPTDLLGLQEITRIWASFHFLPGNLEAPIKRGGRNYRNKFRLICKPNGQLLIDTIQLAKGSSLEGIGIAMHVLADTWAHQNFAGTPSLVINNIENHIYEVFDGNDFLISFSHTPGKQDDIEKRKYNSTFYRSNENSIMNLGHGRAGHLPDLSFIKFKYMPAWGNYEEITKDNPSDYYLAFTQMVYALKYLKGNEKEFELNKYASLGKYEKRVKEIICKRQLSAELDWKKFAQDLGKTKIKPFDAKDYQEEHLNAKNKEGTLLSSFCFSAKHHKSMITNRIYKSKNKLAGYSVEYSGNPLNTFKDYWKYIEHELKVSKNHGKDK